MKIDLEIDLFQQEIDGGDLGGRLLTMSKTHLDGRPHSGLATCTVGVTSPPPQRPFVCFSLRRCEQQRGWGVVMGWGGRIEGHRAQQDAITGRRGNSFWTMRAPLSSRP